MSLVFFDIKGNEYLFPEVREVLEVKSLLFIGSIIS